MANKKIFTYSMKTKEWEEIRKKIEEKKEELRENGHTNNCSYGCFDGVDYYIKDCDCHPWTGCPAYQVKIEVNDTILQVCTCNDEENWNEWRKKDEL